MIYSQPVSDLIRRRYSCRSYQPQPLPEDTLQALQQALDDLPSAPLGSPARFALEAATPQQNSALRGLGTYGMIRHPAAFIIGATAPGSRSLHDFGYRMEALVLRTTDLGLGSCWLGGNFTRASFSRKIAASADEIIPAVCSLGLPLNAQSTVDRVIRQGAGSDRRLPWESLFFDQAFGTPLSSAAAGAYALPLEMLRLGPSASNKQPWRVLRSGRAWHFYIQRTPGYPGGLVTFMLGVADMQAIDLGIAMCHFELAARASSLRGSWQAQPPAIALPDEWFEYAATWAED